jgi:beta-glucosidase
MSLIEFPAGFMWGSATSSYQVEGAWNLDGKGESIWDRFCHTPQRVVNGDSGDIACDQYHRLDEDVALMAQLGLKTYRFSISWPRVLPVGRSAANPKGLDFYDRLVDRLLAAGIVPNATLYHWDLPQALQDEGGWPARTTVDAFADYARLMFERLGDRVALWATINEPWVVSFLGYGSGQMAPGIADASQAYQTAHHLLLAHGRAVQVFRQGGYHGQIGIALNCEHTLPVAGASRREAEANKAACQRSHDQNIALFADPLFTGRYPAALMAWLGSMAPKLQPGDLETIASPIDFLGVNYYTTTRVAYDPNGGLLKIRNLPVTLPMWGHTEMGWGVYPDGLRHILLLFKEHYGNPPMYITENGCATRDDPDANGFVDDRERIDFLRAHFLTAAAALRQGANLRGYYVWSLFDNFEWAEGYRQRFGLTRVDFDTLVRTPKHSFHWYKEVIAANGVWE